MIPVTAQIGGTRWTTPLFPKDGRYIVPLKDLVRRAEGLDIGDVVTVRLAVDVRPASDPKQPVAGRCRRSASSEGG